MRNRIATTLPAKRMATLEIRALPKRRRRLIPKFILTLVLVAGIAVLYRTFMAPNLPDNIVPVSGRIEGDDWALSSKIAGRILELRVHEGDVVKAGEVVAILDNEELKERQLAAEAALAEAQALEISAKSRMPVFHRKLLEAEVHAEQSAGDVAVRVRQAETELEAAEGELEQQKAAFQRALIDRDASLRQGQTGATSGSQEHQAEATANQLGVAVLIARKRVDAANGSLSDAKANLSNPNVPEVHAALVRRQMTQEGAEIESAEANVQSAKARLSELQSHSKDLTVLAPFDGAVMTLCAEPGEVVSAGSAVVMLMDLRKVYLHGFVPEGQVGKVKVGQPARVYLESRLNEPIDAYVQRIDPEAKLTPETSYFHDRRTKKEIGVKLQLKSAARFAEPGMSADGEVLVEGNTWPDRRR